MTYTLEAIKLLANDTRDRLRHNDREGVAWHYGLPDAGQYDCHSDYRRSFTRAANTSYASVCRWIAARGYPIEEG